VPSPEFERMDALSEAIARLLRRQEVTERRLEEIEKALGIKRSLTEPVPSPPPPQAEVPTPAEEDAQIACPTPTVQSQAGGAGDSPAQSPPPQAKAPLLETRLGLAWINRIGAVTLVFFVAFTFKYAVDNAWIGPAGRVALGVIAGLAALAVADRTWRGGQKTYAHGISGLGIAILYLSFYASFGFYHILDSGFAFVLMALTTAMGGVLALRYDAQAIAALGLLGGYATPVLLSTGEDRPWVLFSYVLVLNFGALAAARFRKWKVLEGLAFLATVTLYGGWLADRFAPEKRTVAALFGFVYYGLFAISEISFVFYLSQALIALAIPTIWKEMVGPYALSTLSLAIAGMVISDWRNRIAGVGVTFAAFWLAYAIWAGNFRNPQPVGPVFLFLSAAFLMFLCWIPWRILFRGAALTGQDALLLVPNGAAYFGVCYDLLQKDYHDYRGLFAVALAAAHLGVAFLIWRKLPAENRDTRVVLLSIGIALTFLTLAAPIQFAGYRITMAWSLEVAALAWIGARTNSKGLIYASLAVFVLVLFRLNSIDSWMYPAPASYDLIWNARFLTFLISAAAFWAAAWWIKAEREALVLYLGGHYVMLWGLGLESLGWAARTASPENLRSAESAAISILMACYAVLLVAAGVLYRSALNRFLGLGLIGVVVAKLYLYDVWLLVRIYRIAAFGALGALLLLTSYVYSRNRASIENWWNERNSSS
jgi:uncharacterized membrane protein